ncbi:MAG: hypothetical protein ABF665_09215 [Gluconacetobacter sp.]
MKTVCRFSCVVEVMVHESWSDKAPVSQIVEDAQRTARGRINDQELVMALRKGGLSITAPVFQSVTLTGDNPK